MNFVAIAQSPIFKFALILVAVICALLIINAVSTKKEHMTTVEESKAAIVDPKDQKVDSVDALDSGDYSKVDLPKAGLEITPDDLLPKTEEVKQFEDQFPTGKGDIKGKNFLIASHNFGVNTVGSTHKNPNLQLRSDPQIPRVETGPWNQSTIEPSDLTNRKVFELGA